MNKTIALSKQHQELVSQHLKVIDWAIYDYIQVNEQFPGMGYDDLYQEGCLALCRAAATYNGTVKFKTYAQTVIKNHLIDYCKAMNSRNKTLSLEAPVSEDENYTYACFLATEPDMVETIVGTSMAEQNTLKILASAKPRYKGVALKGIEAIELKVKGYTGKEIAELYGVKSTHVGAWISRAAQKLRQDEQFLSELWP